MVILCKSHRDLHKMRASREFHGVSWRSHRGLIDIIFKPNSKYQNSLMKDAWTCHKGRNAVSWTSHSVALYYENLSEALSNFTTMEDLVQNLHLQG